MSPTQLDDAKERLIKAEKAFMDAARDMNTAKTRYETAKTLLDNAVAAEKSEKDGLKMRISQLETDKLNLNAEVGSLTIKVTEVGKKLDQCCKDKKALEDKKEPKVFLDIAINGRYVGRVTIELDFNMTPLTAENFRALCTGEKGIGRSGKPLHYKGTKFFINGGDYYAGGDIIGNGDSTKGESIYGPSFPAENLTKKHNNPGAVGMIRQGSNANICNGCMFYITTARAERWDGQAVVFGRVVDGMNVVMMIQNSGVNTSVIIGCGQLS